MSDVVILGAGFGGLATAIRLLAAGYRVTIVEALDRPGGRAGVLQLGPYRFDTGPTLITLPSLLEELCQFAGTKLEDELELLPLRPYYRILFADGHRFDYWGDSALDELEIAQFDPQAVTGYRQFLRALEPIYARAFGDLARQPFNKALQFLRVVPQLLRLRAHESVYRFVSRYFREPHLRMVFSFHPLFIGGNPLRASAIYSIVPYLERLEGVFAARGGMWSIVTLLEQLVSRLGGTILYGQAAVQLMTDQRNVVRGVILENGQAITGTAVIANSDIATTLHDLLPPSVPIPLSLRRLMTYGRYSMSCYILYLGLKKQYEQLARHTIIMPLDYIQQLRELFGNQSVLSELAFYLHAPARTDPTCAPPGHESLYILVPVPHLRYARDQWHPNQRQQFRDRVLTTLEYVHGLTDLRNAITTWHEWTPLDFEQVYRSRYGSAFSFEPTLFQSAYFRPHNRSGIPGLYFVGAGTHPGAGLPGTLLSAAVTATVFMADHPVSASSKLFPIGSGTGTR
ncbi:MAG: phytoene desaturase family protein [Thermomicrobium sp.]